MNVRPQLVAAGIALLVLVPAVLYQMRLDSSTYLGLSVVSVLVIVASLYLMFSPAEDAHHDHA